MVWLLVLWFLLSVPLSVVVGRCIAAAERGRVAPAGVPVLHGVPR